MRLRALRRSLISTSILICTALASSADQHSSAKEFLESIKYLSSDELKGRGDGTPELDKAADYIATKFRKDGLKPLGDNGSYLQHFSLVTGAKLGKDNVAAMRLGYKSVRLRLQDDFVPLSFSANGSMDSAVVFAGYGITAPEFKYDDYAGVDAKGKVVIVLRHEPQENDEKSVFSGTRLTSHAEIANKAINAKNHGALGMVLVNDVGNHPGYPDALAKLGDVNGPTEMSIPVIQITVARADELLASAKQTSDGLRQQIDKELKPQSFELDTAQRIDLKVNIERVRKQVANVVGEIPGADANAATQYIVVGAHYDHLGLGEHDSLAPSQRGQVHHGADDNASGTSGVLELAEMFAHASQKPKHSIIFICFAGEELGLLGSAYYAEHPALNMKDAVAMVNMDMIGRVSNNKLYVSGTGTSPGFQQIVQAANEGTKFDVAYSASGYGSSDQTSFTTHDVPVLFFFSGLHTDYHKPSDTWDKINAESGAKVVDLVSNVLSGLDALTAKPQFVRVAEQAPSGSGGGSGYGAYFGSIPDFGEVPHGVKFADVRDGSPAAKAGLKKGDILIEFDGKKIENLYDFTYALRSHKPGDKISVTVMRGEENLVRDVTLEVRK